LDIGEAAYFAVHELESALRNAGRDDYSALFALFINTARPQQREWLTAALTPLRPRNTGRPKAKRDADDATPRQKELADTYETYWKAFDSDAPHADAERLARERCVITDAEFSKLIYNRNSPVNEITKRRGTFRACPTKRFFEASKN
jgi:hypothetical protein